MPEVRAFGLGGDEFPLPGSSLFRRAHILERVVEQARDGLVDIACVLEHQTGHLEQVAHIRDIGRFAELVCVPRERELCGAGQARLISTGQS